VSQVKVEVSDPSTATKQSEPAEQTTIPAAVVEQAAEEVETLHASIKIGTVAQIVIALIAVIGLLYLLKLVLVTIFASILLAYVLEPAVALLVRWRCPRWFGSMVVITLFVWMSLGLIYFSYNRAVDFANEMPRYSSMIRKSVGGIRSRADKIADQARSVVEPAKEHDKPIPVRVEQSQGVVQMISENSSTILDVLMAVGFVPFLQLQFMPGIRLFAAKSGDPRLAVFQRTSQRNDFPDMAALLALRHAAIKPVDSIGGNPFFHLRRIREVNSYGNRVLVANFVEKGMRFFGQSPRIQRERLNLRSVFCNQVEKHHVFKPEAAGESARAIFSLDSL